MLVAHFNGERIVACDAERGPNYRCPECDADLVLKKGEKRIHHFAHHPGSDCGWGKGETEAHLNAKLAFFHEMRRRGLNVDVEAPVLLPSGNRRADVLVEMPSGEKIAFEMQQTQIGVDELEERTRSYIEAGIAVTWLPFFSTIDRRVDTLDWGKVLRVEVRFNPFLAWVEQFSRPDFWLLDPARGALWLARSDRPYGRFRGSLINVLSGMDASVYSDDGLLHHIGEAFSEDIKAGPKWLELRGPYRLGQLDVDSRCMTYPPRESDYPILEHGRLGRLYVKGSNAIPTRVWDRQAEYRQRQFEEEEERERQRAEEARKRTEAERREEEERERRRAEAMHREPEQRNHARTILTPQEGWRQARNGNFHANIKTDCNMYHALIFLKDGEWGGRVELKDTGKGCWLSRSPDPAYVKAEVNPTIEKYEDGWIDFK